MEKARAKTDVLAFFEETIVNIYKYMEYFGMIQESMKVVAPLEGTLPGWEQRKEGEFLWCLEPIIF